MHHPESSEPSRVSKNGENQKLDAAPYARLTSNVDPMLSFVKGSNWPTAALLAQGHAKPPSTEVMT